MKPGDRFGALEVLEVIPGGEMGNHDGTWALVRCECGVRKRIRARHLRYRAKANMGKFRISCGCLSHGTSKTTSNSPGTLTRAGLPRNENTR